MLQNISHQQDSIKCFLKIDYTTIFLVNFHNFKTKMLAKNLHLHLYLKVSTAYQMTITKSGI